MGDWLNNEFCFYFDEWLNSMDEAVQKYASALINNVHNKNFCPDQTRYNILTKYFPEVFNNLIDNEPVSEYDIEDKISPISCQSIYNTQALTPQLI